MGKIAFKVGIKFEKQAKFPSENQEEEHTIYKVKLGESPGDV